MSLLKKLIEVATGEVGTRESNNNSGQKVQEYQAVTTLGGTHWPWCAAFVAWGIHKVCKALKIKNPWCNSASCDVILAWGRAHNIIHTTPQPGDVFLVMASHNDATHTGFVIAVNGAEFTEISGNTNLDGGREGIGVFKRKRINGNRYLFVRWMDLCEKTSDNGYTVKVGGKSLVSVLINGSTFVQARAFGAALGKSVQWNAEKQVVLFDGIEFPQQVRFIENSAYLPLRPLCEFLKQQIAIDDKACSITVSK